MFILRTAKSKKKSTWVFTGCKTDESDTLLTDLVQKVEYTYLHYTFISHLYF